MRVLIIDNYDSFTFNLYQYIGEILTSYSTTFDTPNGPRSEVVVKRNDELTLEDIKALNPDRIIISPGSGSPDDEAFFGICSETILTLGKTIPVFGVCLGMQGIAHCFGGKVIRAPLPMHGKVSAIVHDEKGVFTQLPQQLEVMRYHSLMVEAESLPNCLEITAIVADEHASNDFGSSAKKGSEIMGLRHKVYPIEGVQFHPESFATEGAKELILNFLQQS